MRRACRWRSCGLHLQGSRFASRDAADVDARLRTPRRPHADARLPANARGRDGGVREELAAGVVQWKPKTEVEATSILPLLEREDCTPMACYRSLYAPRTGGAYVSHHRTAGIVGRTRRRGGVAARSARAA